MVVPPDVAHADARRHLPAVADRRGWSHEALQAALDNLGDIEALVQTVDAQTYLLAHDEALLRIGARNANDWPILATALVMDAPIRTQDQDFFGVGVPTWTSDRVELYLDPTRP